MSAVKDAQSGVVISQVYEVQIPVPTHDFSYRVTAELAAAEDEATEQQQQQQQQPARAGSLLHWPSFGNQTVVVV